MGVEIERKFLVDGRPWEGAPGERYVQGYLAVQDGVAVRVRRTPSRCRVTVKGPAQGARRAEFEWDVSRADAEGLLALCGDRLVEKVRHLVEVGDHTWEIDVFEGRNAGLVVAEIELDDEDEAFVRPPWLADEVTDDPRYTNAVLAREPYDAWPSEEA